jgi:hypothetical protein
VSKPSGSYGWVEVRDEGIAWPQQVWHGRSPADLYSPVVLDPAARHYPKSSIDKISVASETYQKHTVEECNQTIGTGKTPTQVTDESNMPNGLKRELRGFVMLLQYCNKVDTAVRPTAVSVLQQCLTKTSRKDIF